jgi:glucose/arabinose dehydrogenase
LTHARRLALALLLLALAPRGQAITLPPGFASTTIVGGFDKPVAVAMATDGRLFVAEKKGLLWLVQGGVKPLAPLLDLRAEVNKESDRGLLGLALHPQFASNGFIYLLYVADNVPGLSHQTGNEAVLQRLARYTVSGTRLDPASRKLLFGATAADSPALCASSHAIGTVRFAHDGSLFVSVGDGAHWEFVDSGQDVMTDDPTCRAMYGAAEDIGAFRARSLDSMAGKILRIDAETGLGLPDNPFYDGDPASKRSRVWSMGFKNPYRFGLRAGTPGPGTLFIGDVGTDHFEEVNASRGGENFGWPCYEGPNPQPAYQADPTASARCAAIPAAGLTRPFFSSPHNRQNRAFGGVIEYRGGTYPSKYRGAIFVTDYAQSFIQALHLDAAGALKSVEDFATAADYPVDLELDPTNGDILYVPVIAGEVRRISYSSANKPPVAMASASPAGGAPPLTVRFSSDGTSDPENDTLAFDWEFGDGTPRATAPNPSHVYANAGRYTAILTVTDPSGNQSRATVAISTLDAPPTARISHPPDGYVFQDGVSIQFVASAADPDGDALAFRWDVELVHAAHVHFDQYASDLERPPPFTPYAHGSAGDRYSYLVRLTVRDPAGLTASHEVHIVPPGLPNAAPVAAFTASPANGPAPLTVAFDAASSADPDGDLLSAAWDFGDGASGAGLQATHTYANTGIYWARVTTTDILGASSTVSKSITVGGPSAGLAGHWPLDENTGLVARDATPNGQDGTLSGPTWTTGKLGAALAFNGTGARVRVPSSAASKLTGRMTVSAFVKLADPAMSRYMRIISKKPRWDAPEGYALSYNPGRQLLEVHGSGANQAYASGVRLDTGWHHLAAVVDGSSARLYVDGVDRTTDGTISSLVAGETALTLGAESGGGSFFFGAIDDVRIDAAARTPAEIAALAAGQTGPAGPAARFAFDEGSGTTARDDGATIGCALTGATWVTGLAGTAASFSGVSSGGSCGGPAIAQAMAPLTVAAWVRVADPARAAYMRLVSTKSTWDAAAGFDLSFNPARGKLEFHGSGRDVAVASGISIDAGWHHMAAVVTGTTTRLYYDGRDVTSDATSSPLAPATAPMRLGRDGAGNLLAGALEDLRVYTRALTPDEVAGLARRP